jgi:dihydroflavonol-4-reductase
MKVFIVGGTGFLGYYSALEFISQGYAVSTLSLPDVTLGDWFPKEIQVSYGNIFDMSVQELETLFKGYDIMVYAVGPDDRILPDAPSFDFFYKRLVTYCGNVVNAAKNAGVKKCIVLGSYFAYFDRIWPEMNLASHHPYIKCRVEQTQQVIAAGGDSMAVMVLELPYIFGTMPERTPIWKDVLVDMLTNMKTIYFPKGGTNMITVQDVAKAIVGASKNGVHGGRYTIGDVNMDFNNMLQIMLDEMHLEKTIVNIPKFLAKLYGRILRRKHKKAGKESGLDPVWLMEDIMTKELYYDAMIESMNDLKYTGSGIEVVKASIRETIRACL